MQSPEKTLKNYLRDNGLKVTPQRKTILKIFLGQDCHSSAEEMYDLIRRKDPGIGQATVYRTMKLFEEAGIARAVNFGDGVTRYERKLGEEHHDHLICEVCRTNLEFVDPEIERLQEELARKHGFVLTHHKMYLYGLCPECRGKKSG